MLYIEDKNKLTTEQLKYKTNSPQYHFFESLFKYGCYWLGRTHKEGIEFENEMISVLDKLGIKYNIVPNFKLEI
jgi:hypothetical protein